ncbi:hypothetical protein Egran_04671 [Elaphomyces granulatus]|uniref:ARS binding protein Abp2 n=1 Tax=Elaphomyces granulatus TaxID=519963 RepID=A0A232LTT2_9EURO|nr:hypothetical protein Egran_04671 [Elaphomyces granulatus]
MESPYRGRISHSAERGELSGPQMVIQQYARYPSNLDPSLHSASTASARSRRIPSPSPPLRRKETPRSLQSSPRVPHSSVFPSSMARAGASMSPPLFDPLSRQRSTRDSIGPADGRVLPPRNITDETIDDAYVNFILYCNPNVPASVDSTELRKNFRSPPRSDGKNFSIFALWELIQKLDRKELKTWIQLAIKLGVEPPSLEKKQSAQKVQQYAVRLKRWMRAMHVDAFFEFCLGHPHSYYTHLPVANGPAFESRDGVPLDEDLALRALVPEWKPKRGRKRAEDKENDELKAVKRPHLDTSVGALHNSGFATHGVNFPQSAIPFSAFPEDLDVDPWGAASSFASDGVADGAADGQADGSLAGTEFHWRAASPVGYPHSAIIPRNHHPAEMFTTNEPQSAVTPSSRDRSRTRRRHGPAVSSAWPGGNGSTTGKVRGRPPNRVSAPGGPFSSFPVNPGRSSTPLADNASLRSSPAITVEREVNPQPSNQVLVDQMPGSSQRPSARPGKLQLQVPPHLGRPIRLATPPTVVLNGTNNGPPPFQPASHARQNSVATSNGIGEADIASDAGQNGPSGSVLVSIEDIIRAVSDRLRRGRLSGRPTPLGSEEARALANAAVSRLRFSYDRASPEYLSLLCATCLGVSHKFGLGGSRPGPVTIKVSAKSSDAMLDSKGLPSTTYTLVFESNPAHGVVTSTVFSDISLGPDVARRHDSLTDAGDELAFDSDLDEEFFDGTMSQVTWKQRYLQLRKQMRKKELAFQEYRRNILNSVMADI